jgi:4-amino-4-deoxy-L-arabinose transferase-like glycosyltransferase
MFGKSPMVGVYWNVSALGINALLICWMAKSISGKSASVIAGLLLVSQFGFYLHAIQLLPECTFMLMLTFSLFFVLFLKNKMVGLLLSGISLGVASFFKTNVFHLPLSLWTAPFRLDDLG